MRRLCLVAILTSAMASQVIDLQACGDKFLRPGRSARMNRYAAMYRATILIYPSPTAKPQVVSQWQKMLKDAGHQPHVVGRSTNLSTVVGAGQYDLVITDYGSAERVRTEVAAAASRPGVVPVLNDPSKASTTRAEAEFEHVLHTDMTPRETLAEIDHVMEVRLRKQPNGSKALRP
jgi:hypothetical protein